MAELKDVIGYGTHADRPAAGSEGRIYYETDTDSIVRDNGTTWDELTLGPPPLGQLIGRQSVESGVQASFLFDAIPSTFRNLKLVGAARGDVADNKWVVMQFNGDVGSNYSYQTTWFTGTSLGGNNSPGQTSLIIGAVSPNNAGAGDAGVFEVQIPEYTQTTFYKGFTGTSFQRYNTSTGQMLLLTGGLWLSTAAISQIRISALGCNFAAGTSFSLYGLS